MFDIFETGTPLAALTGTADDTTITTIIEKLILNKPLVLKLSPNRDNVRFTVIKGKKENLFQHFDWLINCARENGESTPKTIVFCNTMYDIASVMNHMMLKLGKAAYAPQHSRNADNCIIRIYHSCSWEHSKDKVLKSFKENGKVRIVIALSALSMGVNFPDVRYIINYGPARDLLDQHQEIGRAGRDGLLSHSIIMYHGQQLSQCEQSVKDFVKSDGCLRVAAYKALDQNIEPGQILHNCCSFCTKKCVCGGDDVCVAGELPFEAEIKGSDSELVSTSDLTRPVTEEDQKLLTEALEDRCKTLTNTKDVLLDKVATHGFSKQLIDDIVKNCCRIFTVADIMHSSPVFSLQHAMLILEVIQEVFLDIPNFDEAMDLLSQSNVLANVTSSFCLENALTSGELLGLGEMDKDFSDSELDDPDYLC